MKKNLICAFLAMISLISGCSLIPEYSRPDAPVPAQWPKGDAYKTDVDANSPPAAAITWRQFFTDPKLQQIIEIALQNNRDLRIAALNVERARGIYGIQRAELLPTIDAFADGARQKVPGDLSGTGESEIIEQYSVNLGSVAWEIDFFGRIRSLEDRALREYFATEQARRSAQILLIAEVSNAYLTLAADRESLKLARYTLDTQQQAYELIQRRYEIGLSQELDLLRVQTQVDAARVDTAIFTRLVAQDESALNLLVGDSVPPELLPQDLSSVAQSREISAGVSSEVLLYRPDILASENLLMAANANIGAARAALFPRIALTTSVGTASAELSGLFQGGSGAWMFAPQIVMPIFDPRAWSALTVTKTDRKIAVARYEQSIQTAFKEVADALATQGTIEEQLLAQKSLTDAAAETYRLQNTRYLKGIDSYLGVIDAQRSLYAAQQGLVSFSLAKLSNQSRLYAVLGGGADTAQAPEKP
ncbi:MAG: Outer membrane protein OprM precursor [Planctomycetes bacterium ADurb.Bin401]|nr:MAG: Outer membrane protein OprM precursor [Planctomycetes bacterium ADurb.Bin401]